MKSKNTKNFEVFELVRKNSQGGGLATLVRKEYNPVFCSEGDDMEEILVVEMKIKDIRIRVINCYGPQVIDSTEKKQLFWARLHSEVNDAIESRCEIIIQFDGKNNSF